MQRTIARPKGPFTSDPLWIKIERKLGNEWVLPEGQSLYFTVYHSPTDGIFCPFINRKPTLSGASVLLPSGGTPRFINLLHTLTTDVLIDWSSFINPHTMENFTSSNCMAEILAVSIATAAETEVKIVEKENHQVGYDVTLTYRSIKFQGSF
jgi:hypothetical protein